MTGWNEDNFLERMACPDAETLGLVMDGAAVPAVRVRPWHERLVRHAKLIWRSLPYVLGRKKACIGFRNVTRA